LFFQTIRSSTSLCYFITILKIYKYALSIKSKIVFISVNYNLCNNSNIYS
jgi:hypothetical protein